MSWAESINSDPRNPEQRIFEALFIGVPIKVNIFLKTIQDWDAFSTEFRDVCRQYNVEPYIFEGKIIPAEPVPPPIPQDYATTLDDERFHHILSHIDILLFEAKLSKYNDALREYNTVMNNLNKTRSWLRIHVSHSLYEVCSPNFDKDIEDDNPGRWYADLHLHIVVPHQEKVLLESARDKYERHFYRLRKRRSVTKGYLGRWLGELREIVRDGQRRGVPEAADAGRWFGGLLESGAIHAAYRTPPRVGIFVSEVDGKIKRNEMDYEDVIRDIQIALEANGLEERDVVMWDRSVKLSVAEGKKNVSFVDYEVDGEDISPGTEMPNPKVKTRRVAGNRGSFGRYELERKKKVAFEGPEVDNEEFSPGTEVPNPKVRTRRTRRDGFSVIESQASREGDLLQGEGSGTKITSSLESDASKKKKQVTFEEPGVYEEAKDVITVVEEKKVQMEESHTGAKGEEEKGEGRNDKEVQAKKKKSFRGWLRRVGRRVRSKSN